MISPVLPTYNRAALSFVSGQGAWLTEADGSRYLDLTAGIAVNALGHANPALVAALTEQAGKLWHVSNLYQIPQQTALAETLVAETFADTVFFTNSGTEAAELAIKMARKFWYEQGHPERVNILTFSGSFHGRSTGAISASGGEKMVKGFGPLLPGFVHLPFGDHDALRAAFDHTTAAIMVEPIQGEGGVRPLPAEFLRALRALCDEHGILLFYDEVQCGFGRTGHWCGWHATGAPDAVPDAVSWAKGIGGGFPLGAFWVREPFDDLLGPGTHGTTYGGSPLACAAAQAVFDTIEKEDLLANALERGAQLAAAAEKMPRVREVRGAGLLLGVEVEDLPPLEGEEGSVALRLTKRLIKAGLLVVPAGEQTIRLLPPLNVTAAECEEAAEILHGVLADQLV